MIFTPKCACGKRPIVHTEIIPTMAGNIKLHICQQCYEYKRRQEQEQERERERQCSIEEKAQERQARYEYLKREVELAELEEKAKKLGIT